MRLLQISSPDKRFYVTQDEAGKPETIEQVLKQDKLPFALRDDDEEVEKDLW